MSYISRTLTANKGLPNERSLTERDIADLFAPIVILGDPGIGKTSLTELLENQLSALRVSGGTFYRNEDISRYSVTAGGVIIIDGLDEIASSSGSSAVDEVLRKLSRIGNPRFILSCRAADWQGSTDRYKIAQDYGADPITLHLEPFSQKDAVQFLADYDLSIDGHSVLETLAERDLDDFYGNPPTLGLVARLVKQGQGLPSSRADLFARASELLAKEEGDAHKRSPIARSSITDLLDSAGAIFAHMLLSGTQGVADRAQSEVPVGFIPKAGLGGIQNAPLVFDVLATRLFQSAGENLFLPFHRVIAEFLGAGWLSKRLTAGLSGRRILQSMTFAGGVPTQLRGLHAWLAYFHPNLAEQCIRYDPYGVLRYGELERLTDNQARLLLTSLTSLATEDPYFRSEDWGRRAVSGLARASLRDEIVVLIRGRNRSPQRQHGALAREMALLESLPGRPGGDRKRLAWDEPEIARASLAWTLRLRPTIFGRTSSQPINAT